MKTIGKLLLLATVAAVLAALPASASTPRPWYASGLEKIGFLVFDKPMQYKDFTVASIDGPLVGRSSLRGKVVLLNFWATWCPPCREEIPSIDRLYETLKGSAFTVMAVSIGERKQTVTDFVKSNKVKFPVYIDPARSLASAYASRGIPTTYVVDKQGFFIAAVIGSLRYDSPEAIAIFTELASR